MENKFIILLEKYFDDLLSPEEEIAFQRALQNDESLKKEFEEQKRIREVLKKMNLKNPSKEFWDAYWLKFLNRIERAIAWSALIIGAAIVLGFGLYHIVENFIADTNDPPLLKFGIAMLFLGVVILFISILREKLSVRRQDKYKEIQR